LVEEPEPVPNRAERRHCGRVHVHSIYMYRTCMYGIDPAPRSACGRTDYTAR
jgi:hypothetical protein